MQAIPDSGQSDVITQSKLPVKVLNVLFSYSQFQSQRFRLGARLNLTVVVRAAKINGMCAHRQQP